MNIFIASPLGFAESTRLFIAPLSERLHDLGFKPMNPWNASADLEQEIQIAYTCTDHVEKQKKLHALSLQIAERNSLLLQQSDGVLAVLDGTDVDSGTASEIGYAFGLGGKVINGYRGDFRRSGENDGVLVNLQVQYWIEKSGGKIVHSLDDMKSLSFERVP